MKKNKRNKEELSFEQHLENAKEAILKLESGNCSLDEMLVLYENGINSLKFCSKKLNEFEKKVKLIKVNESDEISFEDYKWELVYL